MHYISQVFENTSAFQDLHESDAQIYKFAK